MVPEREIKRLGITGEGRVWDHQITGLKKGWGVKAMDQLVWE
jgi:hypothetical protein